MLYSKKDLDSLSINRDAYILKPLLQNIKEEESSALIKIKSKKDLNIDFSKSFLITSNHQIYKSYSIVGLMTCYNRQTSYTIIDLAFLLDIWYNNSVVQKDYILNKDIVIIHGFAGKTNTDWKAIALIELLSIRKTKGKITWLFIEGMTLQEFDKLYPDVSKSFGIVYHSDL